MAGTNTYINWSAVTATPTPVGGSPGTAIPIDHVTSINPDNTGTVEKFKGDAARFWQVIATPTQERMIEVTTGDVAIALSLTVGAVYTVFGKLGDALNSITASGGGLSMTLVNAVLTDRKIKGEHAKFAEATLKFEAFGATNDTDPMTVATL